MEKRLIEGTTTSVNEAMNAVSANVLREDGMLLRTCEHGIRHPVGHLHRRLNLTGDPNDLTLGHERGKCDDCCEHWRESLDVRDTDRSAATTGPTAR